MIRIKHWSRYPPRNEDSTNATDEDRLRGLSKTPWRVPRWTKREEGQSGMMSSLLVSAQVLCDAGSQVGKVQIDEDKEAKPRAKTPGPSVVSSPSPKKNKHSTWNYGSDTGRGPFI